VSRSAVARQENQTGLRSHGRGHGGCNRWGGSRRVASFGFVHSLGYAREDYAAGNAENAGRSLGGLNGTG